MPLERIGDFGVPPRVTICMNVEHNPPPLMVLEPGAYKYTCPECGREQYFHVRYPSGLKRIGNV